MFKWINKRRFPLGCTVHVEYTSSGIQLKAVGKVVGYPSAYTILIDADEYSNYQTCDTSDCTVLQTTLAVENEND